MGSYKMRPLQAATPYGTFWLALALTSPLTGCIGIAAHALSTATGLADQSTRHDAFKARVVMSLSLGDRLFTATRYAKVYYVTGRFTNHSDGCQTPEPRCWSMTDHFFIGLPDGAIADVVVGPGSGISGADLAGLKPGEAVSGQGLLTAIYADQPGLPAASEFGNCLPYAAAVMARRYGVPQGASSGVNTLIAPYPVPATVTRLYEKEPAGSIVSPDEFYNAKIFDKKSCAELMAGIARDTITSVRPAPGATSVPQPDSHASPKP